ncbi:helix-turn-helix domain-containing protein [Variovorax sp. Varisp85]|uniref:helix-turn-helix domain-containing protein n=1 Tax=Variovorax sp. Varisp85 TaxID=3243059 RepID=UPI0039A74F85
MVLPMFWFAPMRGGRQWLTVVDVARELGVSIRTLQTAFQGAGRDTPMAFLRGVRMARVREALLNATASTAVTEVALQHGFLHLGRFSVSAR